MNVVAIGQHLRELPGFVASIGAVLAIWILSTVSWLERTDHVYYNLVVDSIPQPSSAAHDVLLVETEPAATYDWKRLTDRLLNAGARQIIFISPLTDGDLRALAGSDHAAKFLIGRPLEARESTGVRHVTPLPDDVAGKLKFGIAAVPADESSSHRSQLAAHRVGYRSFPSVETLASMDAGRPVPTSVFLLNFHRGFELPRIGAVRLERELPLTELVRGKTVLVGYAPSPYLAQFNGPGLPRGTLLTQLEFHGLAVDTLLQGKAVTRSGVLTKGILVILFGLFLALAFQPLRLFSAFWVVLALISGMALVAWFSLRVFDTWLPVPEFSLTTVLVFAVVYRAKAKADDHRLRQLFKETSSKLENRLQPASFAESLEHWIHAANLVDQILQLDRFVFLERVANEHRVREIRSLRCSIGDIDEKRRDYRRHPYREAIERRGMIEIDTPYLNGKSPDERQFLAPLIFGSEVLGFWAIAMTAEKIHDFEKFRASVDNIADGLGDLLYQRQLWVKRSNAENQPWRRFLGDDTLHLYQDVSRAIMALERRVTSLEQMFAGLSTAAIVLDLFGRVILINELMTHLLTKAGIVPFETTAVGLIEKLSGRSPDSARQALQALLVNPTPLLLPVVLPGISSGRFVLYVRSLQQSADENNEASSFRTHRLLLELIDGAELHRVYGIKTELVRHLNHQLNNDLATLLGALQLANANPSTLNEMLKVIETQCRSAAGTINRIQDLLAQEIDIDYGGSYPVDPRGAIQGAMAGLQAAAAERDIGFTLRMQTTPFLIYANPRELEETVAIMLGFLLDDAVEGTRIPIDIKVLADHAELELMNTGFGIPQERFDQLLAETAESENESLGRLRLALRRIENWGGTARLRAGLGEGYVVSIQLRTF